VFVGSCWRMEGCGGGGGAGGLAHSFSLGLCVTSTGDVVLGGGGGGVGG
jgi:hypothetical protein